MQQIIRRDACLADLRLRLSESPVVALLGARQVGKTTLARQLMAQDKTAVLFDLERPSGRAALEQTPELTLSAQQGLVIIDEVQRLPGLFSLLRPLVDDPGHRARYLLLGSAAPELVRGVSESLAGRVQFLRVGGFSIVETGSEAIDRLWWRGGFPRAFLASSDAAAWRWLEGFRRTFLERDIPALGIRIAAASLDRFWQMLAHCHGQLWNAAELGRSMGLSSTSVNHYRDLLVGTYMVRLLQPWHANLAKRQVKAPKLYLRDSGLLHHLLGLQAMGELRSHPRYGASWEGFALEQVLARFGDHGAWFWATQRGAELDLLLQRSGRFWGFEFKCSDAPRSSRSMHIACEDLQLEHLWVVYPGSQRYALAPCITALPLSQLAEVQLA